YASERNEGIGARTGSRIVEEVGLDSKYAYDQPDDNSSGDGAPGCLAGDGELAVVGRKNATSVSLYDPTRDQTWRADGSLLTAAHAVPDLGRGQRRAGQVATGSSGMPCRPWRREAWLLRWA